MAMPECPPAASVPWYKSQRFIALVQSSVLYALGWLIQALSMNDWSAWKPLIIALLGNLLIELKDWWHPAVEAPGFAAAMGANKSNEMKAFTKPPDPAGGK